MSQECVNALVIGGSRGIGAAVAGRLADCGYAVTVTFRSHQRRAETVCADILRRGGQANAVALDICSVEEVRRLAGDISEQGTKIAILVLSASGGLERGKPPGYAEEVNVHAQERLLDAIMPHMIAGGRIAYLTSHEAHFSGEIVPYGPYSTIASSKRRGELRLRAREQEFISRNLAFQVLSADLVEGTATAKLLEMSDPGLIELRRQQIGRLPSVEDVAGEVAQFCRNPATPGISTAYVWDPGAKYLSPILSAPSAAVVA